LAFQLTKKFVLICEGPADQIFFKNLFDRRKIRNFDIPQHKNIGGYYGWPSLGRTLRGLAGDPGGYAQLKGIVVIADSGDNITITFNRICRKLKEDGPFGTPSAFIKPNGPYQITRQPIGHPPISVMLIPESRSGALETLCVESVLRQKVWLKGCVETYLSCKQLDALNWRAEKRDKAKMQCIIAGLYKKDPNKGLGHLFSVRPAIVNFRSTIFTPLVKQIQQFCMDANNL
jgi:hypothetical protein